MSQIATDPVEKVTAQEIVELEIGMNESRQMDFLNQDCAFARALPRSRPSRTSLGHKPIRLGQCAQLPDR
jgi:hypothetical protein